MRPSRPDLLLQFFKSYLQQLRHMVREGFVSQQHEDHIIVESDVTKLLNKVACSLPPIHLFCFVLMLIECD
jgi:predicted Rossmann-fold nucleotide-binding protein